MAAVGNVVSSVFGGQKKVQGAYGEMSPEEEARLKSIEGQIENLFDNQSGQQQANLAQSQQIQNLFANNLKSFLTKGSAMTPEDIKQASDFVDQTFTNPAQNVVNQNVADYQSQAQGRAAALGRNPNADIATQQAIAGEGIRQNVGLQAERGARIQQATTDQYNRGLSGLNAGMQGSGFLNNLTQQAFQNQMGLLNARTGLADFYQKERSKYNPGPQTSPGLLGGLTAGIGQVSGLMSAGQGLGTLIKGTPSSGQEYTSSNNSGQFGRGNFSL